MYKVYQTQHPEKLKLFDSEVEANDYIKRQRKAKSFYTLEVSMMTTQHVKRPEAVTTIVSEIPTSSGQKTNPSTKVIVDFTGAIQITRENVKHFYNKAGDIKVVAPNGTTLHVGKTKNMGKVFSNYVNCSKYNQSYDFNLAAGDKLFFKEEA